MNTFERCLIVVAAAGVLAAPVCAQSSERQANFTGGGGRDEGKCTIEVFVDGAADVEIRGDRGFLRTLNGQTAQWRRFVCSGPMPASPGDFRFIGIDGRGRQELIQDPRSSRGAAVVRIQDTQGGGEGYTFDLVWRGAGLAPGPTGPPMGGGDRGFPPNDARRDEPGARDREFSPYDARRDEPGDRDRGFSPNNAGRYDPTLECRRTIEQRIRRDGYRNVQFDQLNLDNRRRDRIFGAARAQRGNNGRTYDFTVGCLVNPDNGSVRSVQVNRR